MADLSSLEEAADRLGEPDITAAELAQIASTHPALGLAFPRAGGPNPVPRTARGRASRVGELHQTSNKSERHGS